MRTIELTQGHIAIIDDDDFERVSQYKWCSHERRGTPAAKRRRKDGKNETLHRFILGLEHGDGEIVDHINGNGLDNRKENLRLCTNQQNLRNVGVRKNNTSGFKGVSWSKGRGNWQVNISTGLKVKSLGRFKDKLDAVRAYNDAAIKYHGEYAYLNVIPEGL